MLLRRRLFMNAKKLAPLNLPVSRQNINFPSRNRTAPKYPTLRRVGACSKTGSLVSGGIHIWHREPCCWKCTSPKAQLPEQALPLPHPQVNLIPLGNPVRQGLAVPQSSAQPHIARHTAKGAIDLQIGRAHV